MALTSQRRPWPNSIAPRILPRSRTLPPPPSNRPNEHHDGGKAAFRPQAAGPAIINRLASARQAMKRADLVAVGIAKIGEIQSARRVLADARRLLDRLPAIGEPGGVPRIRLFRSGHREADGTAVGVRGGFPVDRLRDHEDPAAMRVDQAAFVILDARLAPERLKQRVVELPGLIDVVTAHHHMTEHSILPQRLASKRYRPTKLQSIHTVDCRSFGFKYRPRSPLAQRARQGTSVAYFNSRIR